MSTKQSEFDFEQYNEPKRLYKQPATEYFRRAFDIQTVAGPVTVLADPNMQPHQIAFVQKPILSTDSAERKNTPIWSTIFKNWPLALAALARHCKRGNDKHNPGQPIHWAREKSSDHEDCAARHLVDVNHFNAEINEYEEACAMLFRAFCIVQLLEEKRLGR